jgi:hypothetical protein
MRADIERSVFMALLGLFALAGLFVASRSGDGVPYWGGITMSVACVGTLFYAISRITRSAH